MAETEWDAIRAMNETLHALVKQGDLVAHSNEATAGALETLHDAVERLLSRVEALESEVAALRRR